MPDISGLVSTNPISAIALIFFATLLYFASNTTVQMHKTRIEVREARIAASDAAKNAKPVSNGFVKELNGKIDHLTAMVDNVQEAQRAHLEWHMNREEKEHG